jgi:hypothetical protein
MGKQKKFAFGKIIDIYFSNIIYKMAKNRKMSKRRSFKLRSRRRRGGQWFSNMTQKANAGLQGFKQNVSSGLSGANTRMQSMGQSMGQNMRNSYNNPQSSFNQGLSSATTGMQNMGQRASTGMQNMGQRATTGMQSMGNFMGNTKRSWGFGGRRTRRRR